MKSRRKEEKNKRNQEKDCEEGKDTFYLTDSIKNFITTIVQKHNEDNRTDTISSLYNLLGQNMFHQNMTKFAHDFGEEVQVVCFQLSSCKNRWVSEQAYQLMFGDNKMSEKSIREDVFGDYFKKILAYHDNKMIYLTKEEDNKVNMIEMVIFAE